MYEDRTETIKTIDKLKIKNKVIAAGSGLNKRRITDFMLHEPLPEPTVARIKTTVDRIAFVWDTFQPYRLEITSPEILTGAFENAQHRKMLEPENTNG